MNYKKIDMDLMLESKLDRIERWLRIAPLMMSDTLESKLDRIESLRRLLV